jgi:cystathionine beta-lyase/cystathionine gamma-synthase
MHPRTRELHDAIDANAPWLHPTRKTIQRDLKGSPEVIAWQEGKINFMVGGDGVWSQLPQLYARYGTGGTSALIDRLRALEGAAAALVTDCGMQAFALVVDAIVARDAHVITMRQVYNKTRTFLELTCKRVGATITVVDDGDHEALAAALNDTTSFVFAETFTNPLLRAQDIPALVAIVKKHPRAKLVIDSTIATPWAFATPLLAQGVDVVIGSLTKALGGQDAALGGYIATNDCDLGNAIMDLVAMRGGILDDARAQTVVDHLDAAKLDHALRCESATAVAAHLSKHPAIEAVFHPSLHDAALRAQYLRPGSLLSFRVRHLDEMGHRGLADALASTGIIRYALSFDGPATKVNHHRTVSEYFTPPEVVAKNGIDRLIRLGIGTEHAGDLIAAIDWALGA